MGVWKCRKNRYAEESKCRTVENQAEKTQWTDATTEKTRDDGLICVINIRLTLSAHYACRGEACGGTERTAQHDVISGPKRIVFGQRE